MTKQEAIKEFRKQWNWMADETEKRKRKVYKDEYFEENHIEHVYLDCYCCEYDCQFYEKRCDNCPLLWEKSLYGYSSCLCDNSYFHEWRIVQESDWETAAKIARKIANLPENPGAKERE